MLTQDARDIMWLQVVPFFAAIGLPLEYFPEDEEEGMREMWQHDGGLDGVVVQLVVGMNGAFKPGIFGDIDIPGKHDGGYDLSSCAEDWVVNYEEYVKELL